MPPRGLAFWVTRRPRWQPSKHLTAKRDLPPRWPYIVAAGAIGFAATWFSEYLAAARIQSLRTTPSWMEQPIHSPEPQALAVLAVPFMLIGLACSLYRGRKSIGWAMAASVVAALALGWLYHAMYLSSLNALYDGRWTAAGLSSGFRLIYGSAAAVAFLIVCFSVRKDKA